MTADELELIEEENDVRRERSSADPNAVRDIDRLVAEVKRLQHELQIKTECEIDLTNELDTKSSTPENPSQVVGDDSEIENHILPLLLRRIAQATPHAPAILTR